MNENHPKILLNEILQLENLDNVKIRFVKSHEKAGDPLDLFNTQKAELRKWLLWNYNKKKSFREGMLVFGFVRISGEKWLLFDSVKITKDLDVQNGVGYECQLLSEYEKYLGRIVIHYKNRAQNLVRNAESVMGQCSISQVLDGEFNHDVFPGYDSVRIPWEGLRRVIDNDAWRTALENQKGIYLIADKKSGKLYVGSAYGEKMLHGRWSDYVKTGHGGNENLKGMAFEYIQENFNYSILEIYKSTTPDDVILNREYWWQETLCTKIHGYNLSDTGRK